METIDLALNLAEVSNRGLVIGEVMGRLFFLALIIGCVLPRGPLPEYRRTAIAPFPHPLRLPLRLRLGRCCGYGGGHWPPGGGGCCPCQYGC